MAINTQKFLPSSKGGSLVKVNKTLIKGSSSVAVGDKSIKNLSIVRVKAIEVDSILKGTLAAEKKKLTESKKQDSSKRREKIEEKLETKPKVESGKVKMPSLPRMGFLDWVKNFIGNIILGYFAVRLVDHLPKIIPIVKFLGQATDFVLGVGGKLLDGLVTFIDWGYKAYDATRGFVKNLFGNDGVKQFEQLSGLLNQFLNLALIAGMAAAGSVGRGGKGKGGYVGSRPRPGTGGRPRVTTSDGGVDIRNPLRQRPKVTMGRGGNKALLSSVRPFLKRIPLPIVGALVDFGLSVALGENPGRAAFRAIGAGLLGAVGAAAGTVVPVAGNFIGGLIGGVAGDAIGGVLYDFFFGSGMPSGKGKTVKKAGGGATRSGRPQRGVKRTISRKSKYRRRLTPQKPGDVEANSPGADVGGEDKLFGLFPNPFKMFQKAVDVMNPFKVIQKAGQNLGDSDYFGPILAITSKILLGQKPTQQDYKNVGLGINMLVAKGIDDGKLRGGLAAFAEGGFVDPKTLDAIAQGGDISDWVAKSFKDSTETNAQKTLREIQENLKLKPGGAGPDKSDPTKQVDEGDVMGGTGGQWGPLLDLIASVESGNSYEALNPSTTLPGATKMTISRVAVEAEKIGRSKGGTGAVGRYQQLPWYLVSRARAAGLNPDKDLFSPKNQDLIVSKVNIGQNRGGRRWLSGEISDEQFMQGLSQEFAAIPNAQGKFYYGGQKSSMTPARVKVALGKVRSGGHSQKELSQFENVKMGKEYGSGGKALFGETGNVSNSPGWVHGHFQGSDPRSVVRDTSSVVKGLLRQGSPVFLNPGVDLTPGKKYSDSEIMKYVEGARKAHTHSGSGSSIDVFVKKGTRVPVPLTNIGPSGSGFGGYGRGGLAGYIQGTKTWIGHLDPSSKYEKGGMTLGGPHMAMLGEKGKEFVIDADSTAAIEQTFPGFLGAINTAKYDQAINVLSNFASYEYGSEQVVVIADMPSGSYLADSDDTGSGGPIYVGGDETDPFESLYQGG
jgi:hypothetical protein